MDYSRVHVAYHHHILEKTSEQTIQYLYLNIHVTTCFTTYAN